MILVFGGFPFGFQISFMVFVKNRLESGDCSLDCLLKLGNLGRFRILNLEVRLSFLIKKKKKKEVNVDIRGVQNTWRFSIDCNCSGVWLLIWSVSHE